MQFFSSGGVVMTIAFNGRVFSAQESEANVRVVSKGSIYAIDSWAIPKGSRNNAVEEPFIGFSLRPENQKIHTEKLGYGSTNHQTRREQPVAPESAGVLHPSSRAPPAPCLADS